MLPNMKETLSKIAIYFSMLAKVVTLLRFIATYPFE